MKIGLMGGTFDPIHLGHLFIADHVRDEMNLDEIWFIPSRIPPHKTDKHVTDAGHRLQMVKLAIQDVPYFRACSLELERKGPSYTIDTVSELNRQFPNDKFYFIIGGDMIDYLPHWHRIDELVQKVQFIGVHRPGFKPDNPMERSFVKYIEMPQMDISSTQIRERFKHRKSIRFMVTEAVRIYIEENRLYDA